MSNVTILDGGMGQELIHRAGHATSMWSMKALIDAPETVRAVHDDFFAAGADVATTNSYSILPDRLKAHGLGDRLDDLTVRACTIAAAARDAHGTGTVAGALGPIGFSYRPDMAPPAADAAEIYAHLATMQGDLVDVHLLETMASVDQARGGIMGASVTGKPVWLALSVDDRDGTRLRSGEPLGDIVALLRDQPVARVLLNCSIPEAVTAGLPIVAEWGLPFGAYANGFTGIADGFDRIGATVDLLSARRDLDPAAYADHAAGWHAMGARTIGGCCEIGPDHIAELSRRFA